MFERRIDKPEKRKLNPNNSIPPKSAQRFLCWFLKEELAEEVLGDLEEKFYATLEERSLWSTRLLYWLQVFHYLRPFAIKNFKLTYSNPTIMFRHNFIISFRNFQRNKSSFFINLVGLSTGLACALLIYLWVNDELSIDKFHEKDSQLYQVMKNYVDTQGIDTGENAPGLLGRALEEEMPEVEAAVSVFPPADFTFKGILSVDETHVKARSKFADHDFFKIFTYPLLQGNEDQVLSDPSSVVISEELASHLFHTTDDVVGKRVTWKGERHSGDFRIAGIFENPPANATIQFDIVFNYDLIFELFNGFENWGNNGPSTIAVRLWK